VTHVVAKQLTTWCWMSLHVVGPAAPVNSDHPTIVSKYPCNVFTYVLSTVVFYQTQGQGV